MTAIINETKKWNCGTDHKCFRNKWYNNVSDKLLYAPARPLPGETQCQMASLYWPLDLFTNQTGTYTFNEFFGLSPTPIPPSPTIEPSPTLHPTPSQSPSTPAPTTPETPQPTLAPTPIPTPEPVWQKLELDWDYQVPGEDSPLNYKFSIDFGNMSALFTTSSGGSFQAGLGIFGASPGEICTGGTCAISFVEQVFSPFAYHDDSSNIHQIALDINLNNLTQEAPSSAWSHSYYSMPVKYNDDMTTPYRFVNFVESEENFQSCAHPDTPIIHTSNNVDYYLFGIDRVLTGTGYALRILYFKQATATRKVLDGFQTVDSDKCHPFWVTTNTSTPGVEQPFWPRLRALGRNHDAFFGINQLLVQNFVTHPLWTTSVPHPYTPSILSNGQTVEVGSFMYNNGLYIGMDLSSIVSEYFTLPHHEAPLLTMVHFQTQNSYLEFSNDTLPEYVTLVANQDAFSPIVIKVGRQGPKMVSLGQFIVDLNTAVHSFIHKKLPQKPAEDPSNEVSPHIITYNHYLHSAVRTHTLQKKANLVNNIFYLTFVIPSPGVISTCANLPLSMGYIVFDVIDANGFPQISYTLCVDILSIKRESSSPALYPTISGGYGSPATASFTMSFYWDDIPIPWSGEPPLYYPGTYSASTPSWETYVPLIAFFGDFLHYGNTAGVDQTINSGVLSSNTTGHHTQIFTNSPLPQATYSSSFSFFYLDLLSSGYPWTYQTPWAFIAISGFEISKNGLSTPLNYLKYDYVPIHNGKLVGTPTKIKKFLSQHSQSLKRPTLEQSNQSKHKYFKIKGQTIELYDRPNYTDWDPGCWAYDEEEEVAYTRDSVSTIEAWHIASQYVNSTQGAQSLGFCR